MAASGVREIASASRFSCSTFAIRSFAVRPTSSVLRYGPDADPLRAGRELGVAFVLDGRIRRSGDRIRVTIQLLNVRDEESTRLNSSHIPLSRMPSSA